MICLTRQFHPHSIRAFLCIEGSTCPRISCTIFALTSILSRMVTVEIELLQGLEYRYTARPGMATLAVSVLHTALRQLWPLKAVENVVTFKHNGNWPGQTQKRKVSKYETCCIEHGGRCPGIAGEAGRP